MIQLQATKYRMTESNKNIKNKERESWGFRKMASYDLLVIKLVNIWLPTFLSKAYAASPSSCFSFYTAKEN